MALYFVVPKKYDGKSIWDDDALRIAVMYYCIGRIRASAMLEPKVVYNFKQHCMFMMNKETSGSCARKRYNTAYDFLFEDKWSTGQLMRKIDHGGVLPNDSVQDNAVELIDFKATKDFIRVSECAARDFWGKWRPDCDTDAFIVYLYLVSRMYEPFEEGKKADVGKRHGVITIESMRKDMKMGDEKLTRCIKYLLERGLVKRDKIQNSDFSWVYDWYEGDMRF